MFLDHLQVLFDVIPPNSQLLFYEHGNIPLSEDLNIQKVTLNQEGNI